MNLQDTFVRYRGSSGLLDRFLIASLASILLIRLYLQLTNYPKIGGGGLHISHMLWGGLGMLIALIVSLSLSGKRVQSMVALIGGIGFGTFIDELGKFITSDNDYLFQPTLALIYLIFLLLLLSFLILERPRLVWEQNGLARAAYVSEKQNTTSWYYQFLVSSPHFVPTLSIFFIGYMLLLTAFGVSNLLMSSAPVLTIKIGWLVASFLSYILVVVGIVRLRKSRVMAAIWLKRAVLVSIFLAQIFLLYTQPMYALVTLLVNLIVLAALNYLIRINPLR